MEASQTVTGRLVTRYHQQEANRTEALTEVLCSAYKDATGVYPNDFVREKIYEAVR